MGNMIKLKSLLLEGGDVTRLRYTIPASYGDSVNPNQKVVRAKWEKRLGKTLGTTVDLSKVKTWGNFKFKTKGGEYHFYQTGENPRSMFYNLKKIK